MWITFTDVKQTDHQVKEIAPGKFEITEVRTFTGGPNMGEQYESKSIVFESEDLAGKEAASHLAFMGSNTVFLGLNKTEFEGRLFYSPSYNVFD